MSFEIGTGIRGKWLYKEDEQTFVPFAEVKPVRTHSVLQDTMEEIESMATPFRQKFTSRSAYRRHLKEYGFRETGGEHLKDVMYLEMDAAKKEVQEKKDREMKEDIQKAISDVKYDRVKFSEIQKEVFKREERNAPK